MNFNTFGYKTERPKLASSSFGVILAGKDKIMSPALSAFMKGEKVTKLSIDRDWDGVFFMAKDDESQKEYLTRLGDFKYTRTQRAKNTYIGKPLEERTYLTTQDDYLVMGYPIGKGPVTVAERFKDPLIDPSTGNLGDSAIRTEKRDVGKNIPYQFGPLVPIDLTRGPNGLILDRYENLEVNSQGIVRGLKDGLWVPLYKMALFSVPNQDGLASIGNTPYRVETEESGLREKAPDGVKIRNEQIEKSNVDLRYDSYHYRNLRNSLQLALQLQRSNTQLFQQFQQLIPSQ
ncbi:MAG TPA: hypothetical protein V6C96_03470 [Vampirovibrionales bacterium]